MTGVTGETWMTRVGGISRMTIKMTGIHRMTAINKITALTGITGVTEMTRTNLIP